MNAPAAIAAGTAAADHLRRFVGMPDEREARLAAAREPAGVPVAPADLKLLFAEAEWAPVAVPPALQP